MSAVSAAQYLCANEHILQDIFAAETGLPAGKFPLRIEEDAAVITGTRAGLVQQLHETSRRWGPFQIRVMEAPLRTVTVYDVHISLLPTFLRVANRWGMAAATARYSMSEPLF